MRDIEPQDDTQKPIVLLCAWPFYDQSRTFPHQTRPGVVYIACLAAYPRLCKRQLSTSLERNRRGGRSARCSSQYCLTNQQQLPHIAYPILNLQSLGVLRR